VKAKVLKVDRKPAGFPCRSRQCHLAGTARRSQGKGGIRDTRTPEQVLAVTPELRRLREKFGGKNLKGGIG